MARMLEWFPIPFSSGQRFVRIFHHVRILHHDLSILSDLHGMAHSFIELCKHLCITGQDWKLWEPLRKQGCPKSLGRGERQGHDVLMLWEI